MLPVKIDQFTFLPKIQPEWRPEPENLNVDLDQLPPNEKLPGPPPAPGLISTMDRYALLQPVILLRTKAGAFRVACGRRRIKAARQLKWKEIASRIFPDNWTLREVLTVIENEQRKANPIADLRAIKSLIQQGATQEELILATSLTANQLKARLALGQLPDELLDAMETGRLSQGAAKAALKGGPQVQATVKEWIEAEPTDKRITTSRVEKMLRAERREIRDQFAAQLFGQIQSWRQQTINTIRLALNQIPDAETLLRRKLDEALAEIEEASPATIEHHPATAIVDLPQAVPQPVAA